MNNVKKLYIETYGCQMNVADSELIVSIMQKNNVEVTKQINQADIIFVNTCAIRENAEQRVFGRLEVFKQLKKQKPGLLIGVLGCMAERLKTKLLEQDKMIDLVIGPDAYRQLPILIKTAQNAGQAINVQLSKEETYSDIAPVRYAGNGISAFVSIMRGCNNMCAFCVVPFVRGRERSRSAQTIIDEIKELEQNNFKEITLIGQNVDKYHYKNDNTNVNFAQLLTLTAQNFPKMRIRFATSYPQDMTDEVLHTMAKYENICKYIHLPVQSGSTAMLEKMKRGYTRQWYLDRINAIRRIVPDCAVSTDIIAGFCSETEADHQDTLSLINEVKFDYAYMFKYSERPNTYAQRKYENNIPDEIKSQRLQEIIDLQRKNSEESNKKDLDKTYEILIEGISKKSTHHFVGRNSQNKMVVFPKGDKKIGEYCHVKITDCTSATLLGELINK